MWPIKLKLLLAGPLQKRFVSLWHTLSPCSLPSSCTDFLSEPETHHTPFASGIFIIFSAWSIAPTLLYDGLLIVQVSAQMSPSLLSPLTIQSNSALLLVPSTITVGFVVIVIIVFSQHHCSLKLLYLCLLFHYLSSLIDWILPQGILSSFHFCNPQI